MAPGMATARVIAGDLECKEMNRDERKSIHENVLTSGLGDLHSNSMRACFSRFPLFGAALFPSAAAFVASKA
jgi:hypothetical protein